VEEAIAIAEKETWTSYITYEKDSAFGKEGKFYQHLHKLMVKDITISILSLSNIYT